MHTDYDQLLAVQTKNKSFKPAQDAIYNPYEATPYSILHALFDQYQLVETDRFVDFGCGKGRLLFYAHHLFGVHVTGIEMDRILYEKAVHNKQLYLERSNLENSNKKNPSIQIECCLAEQYDVKERENKFYFFNPFSGEVFEKVIQNIVQSVERYPRIVDVILYYPLKEYIHYLEQQTVFERVQEVKIRGLSRINPEERFLIYQLNV